VQSKFTERIAQREFSGFRGVTKFEQHEQSHWASGMMTRGGSRDPTKTRRSASLYRVLLLNDDYTPMEFVVIVLERFFQKGREDATQIMLHVHQHGVGECGIYTFEVAETKVTQVMDFARKHQHPLQCVMEKK
jgi:ATP-dependent Clp protease adaptor protein ClpS